MAKQPTQPPRHADKDCACDRCFKPRPEDEKRAAEWWRALYARNGWPVDDLGYL